MAKTARDAWKHIREWSEFFSNLRSATNEDVERFLANHKKRKYLNQSLKRLQEQGFINYIQKQYRPTKEGRKFFKRQVLLKQVSELGTYDIKQWDGKWRLVSFDVPVGQNKERDVLRRFLREFNFYQLHKSVWIYPNHVAEEFWKILVDSGTDRFCKVMVVEHIEGDRKIRTHFFGKKNVLK